MRRLLAGTSWFWPVLACTGGCSLHSLDYLDAGLGGAAAAGASSGGTTGSASGSGPEAGAAPLGGDSSHAGSGGGAGVMGNSGGSPELPDCTDEAATADETDVDCGGRSCEPCPAGKKCVTGSDCASAICTNQVCQAPTCSDLAVNGDETDLNCGGACAACELGQHCRSSSDCATDQCSDDMCQNPTCQEGVLQDGCPLIVDNTAYTLSPGHAPTSCLDNTALSADDGNHMVLWSCSAQLHQTFWAVAQADGSFALRNALSGKCLQVRGASSAEGAAIEQSTCNYAPEQLWLPTRVDSSLMRLVSKLSGLALDVEGTEVGSNGQDIVQGAGNGSDTHWRLEKRHEAAHVALSPYADKSLRISHSDSTVTLTTDDTAGAHWRVVPGLADSALISFQSRDEPGRYLRHQLWRLWADTNDGSEQFKKDATFQLANPLIGVDPLTRSLPSFNYPGRRVSRGDGTVLLPAASDTTEYETAVTWWLSTR
jgi:hypothetical protein